jgi:hypothetical protein
MRSVLGWVLVWVAEALDRNLLAVPEIDEPSQLPGIWNVKR